MANAKELRKRLAMDDLDLPDIPKKKKIPEILFKDFIIDYMEHCETDKAETTLKRELERINAHFAPAFGNLYLSEITPQVVQAWKTSRISAVKQRTLGNDLEVLKSIFAYAKRMGYFQGPDPVGKLPKIFDSEIRIYSPEEMSK